MKLSSKSEYACLALIDLGEQNKDSYVKIDEISERKKIPKKFLEQILLTLKNQGIVKSRRGPYGGYRLAKKPGDISIAEIVRLMDGALAPINSVSEFYFDETPLMQNEGLLNFMTEIRDFVSKKMEETTFDEFINRKKEND